MIKIIEYSKEYYQDLIFCIEKLQDFIIEIDPYNLNIRTKDYGKNSIDNLLEKIEKENGMIYIAKSDEKVVGFIAGIFGFTESQYKDEFKYIKMGNILELFIDESYRGQKIGQLLMEKMEEYFKDNDCEYSYVSVFASNIGAHGFYEKLGFSNRMVSMSKKI